MVAERLPVTNSSLPESRQSRHDDMKQELIGWSQRYATALRRYLKPSPLTGLRSASRLGGQAVVLGLETLELARIHGRTLASLPLPRGTDGLTKRAEILFARVNGVIEETHRDARESKAQLSRLRTTLNRRTKELAVTHRQLQRGVRGRAAVINASQKSERVQAKRLKESLRLQNLLRRLTHRVLVAQEDERRKISAALRDEIAQTLLGINVRLLNLKRATRGNRNEFKNEIASAQRLVLKSAQAVRHFARELGRRQPKSGIRSSRQGPVT